MAEMGNYVIYLIMICAVIGAFASIYDQENGLGAEFMSGLYSIGPIFVPVAGVMAAIPYLSQFISVVFGPLFSAINVDPAIAATTFVAVDMGGYQLADILAETREGWIIAMVVGYMAGATIVFSIPVGLAMLKEADHKYMALGVMAGILSVPIGVFVACTLLAVFSPEVRESVATNTDSTLLLTLNAGTILINIMPLIVVCLVLAIGLKVFPNHMIRSFLVFGRIMDAALKLVLVFSIVEYFTGIFTNILGGWGFDPIIADEKDMFRALEIAGYIGIMLSGAFPMVYMIKKYLARPMEVIGGRMGMDSVGAAGILAASANILAMFHLIVDMKARDKVLCIAFAVCGAFIFGDHLAFTANFQPNMILPILLGKLAGGIFGFILAMWISVPVAQRLEQMALEDEVSSRKS
ncbi:MAG: ethanolamine utilization protein EutH [Cyclobacteriaceae bacterium]|nr:ethanolamine utilization protein EutH [Cyclobacteriaceae bacterium]